MPEAPTTRPGTYFILREPRCVPELKGPWLSGEVKARLIEFMDARPAAYITVLDISPWGRPSVQDGPEALEVLDGRYKHRARRHRATTHQARLVERA